MTTDDQIKAVQRIGEQVADRLHLPLSKKTIAEIMEEVTANRSRLDACPKHKFVRVEPDNILSDYRCAFCGGTVRGIEARWYMKGLEHARL